ncbi:MAG: aminodeoxychorismate synthase component I [Gammaproteobacteria bacterium]|nr:aminodeoxychorismate synthase component I [Gammaproteobacteria bacterium]MDH4312138.1 aminodeoxychorismate synthase component I [Gammaproteobacteria bacterium]
MREADLLALHERFPARYPVLLESVGGEEPLGRHDVLFALPGERLVQAPDGQLLGDVPEATSGGTFLEALDRWVARERGTGDIVPGGAVFAGGWFLYLGYELAGEIEPTLRLPASHLPRAVAWRMHGALLRDRRTREVRIVARDSAVLDRLREQVRADLAAVAGAAARIPPAVLATAVAEQEPQVFLDGVHAVLDAIARGDVYQANLSRSWRARLAPGATVPDLYQALRLANPAPFAALAQFSDFALLSSSPERLLQLRDGIASTRPIAGTRPRGRDAAADASLKDELKLNEKERAEHIMLVDLERNDLGRICRGGTVEVDEFMTIETYATVHHIVSNVRGVLRDDVTPGQAIAAVFPGGTITGCPKVRCMDLLAGLEREPRDAYTGSLGYLDLGGAMDLNILIRTLTVRDREIGFRTGAGIVADSVPEAELAETRAKANGILRALGERR